MKPTALSLFFLFISCAPSVQKKQEVSDEPLKPLVSEQMQRSYSCGEISDHFCSRLWHHSHAGNLKREKTQIFLGETQQSRLKMVERLDFEALMASLPRQPQEIKRVLKPFVRQLRLVFKREQDQPEWYRELALVEWQIQNALKDLAEEKVEKKYKYLKKVKVEDRKTHEISLYVESYQDILNDIVKAKYEESPQWRRVIRNFLQAQKDMQKEVAALNLPQKTVERMQQKVDSLGLSLPYSDPRILSSSGCAPAEVNAYYVARYNKVTVCPGLFYGLQSDAALYTVLAHEMAHAIDPGVLAYDAYNRSPMAQAVKTMFAQSKQTYSCEKWKQLRQSVFAPLKTIRHEKTGLEKLSRCLVNKQTLFPFELSRLKVIAAKKARSYISLEASSHHFTRMIQSTWYKKGRSEENEFRLRADLMRLKENDYFHFTQPQGFMLLYESFLHEFLCAKPTNEKEKLTAQRVFSEREKTREVSRTQKAFKHAIKETQKIVQRAVEEFYSYCGDECSQLAVENMAKSSAENFADWMANKLVMTHLRQLKTKQEQIEFLEEARASHCRPPGPEKEAPQLTSIEKRFSLESHDDARVRRLSLFTPGIQKLVSCADEKGIENHFGYCEL